jgi:hypothetical protein
MSVLKHNESKCFQVNWTISSLTLNIFAMNNLTLKVRNTKYMADTKI